MAFVHVETWQAPSPRPALAMGHGSARSPFIIPGRVGDPFRRVSALVISFVIQAGLMWLLINRLAGAGGVLPDEGNAATSMTLVELSMSAEAELEVNRADAAMPAERPETEIDLSTPSDLPTPEWSVTRIQVERPRQAAPAPAPAEYEAARMVRAGAAGSGAGQYDPYAGAAPSRRQQALAASSVQQRKLRELVDFDETGFRMDRTVFEAARRQVLRQRDARGAVQLIVRISSTGAVLSVDSESAGVSPAVVEALRRALIGEQLFIRTGPHPETKWVRLPVIHLA